MKTTHYFIRVLSVVGFNLLASQPVRAYTDQTDFLPPSVYNRQYAARTECEVPRGNTGSKVVEAATTEKAKIVSTPIAVTPVKPTLEEQLIKVLLGDCGNVRTEKNQIICEDYGECIKVAIIEGDPNCENNEYSPCPSTLCTQWQMRERWRFNPNAVGKVDGLLIDTQYVKLPQSITLGFAFRPVEKNEMYPLQTENATRQVRNILNYGR